MQPWRLPSEPYPPTVDLFPIVIKHQTDHKQGAIIPSNVLGAKVKGECPNTHFEGDDFFNDMGAYPNMTQNAVDPKRLTHLCDTLVGCLLFVFDLQSAGVFW